MKLIPIFILLFLIIFSISGIKSKKIKLPEEAHNTIGEIPLIEQIDDGNVEGKNSRYFMMKYYGPSNTFDFKKDAKGKFYVIGAFGLFNNLSDEQMKNCRVEGNNGKTVTCKKFYGMSEPEMLEKLWNS